MAVCLVDNRYMCIVWLDLQVVCLVMAITGAYLLLLILLRAILVLTLMHAGAGLPPVV